VSRSPTCKQASLETRRSIRLGGAADTGSATACKRRFLQW